MKKKLIILWVVFAILISSATIAQGMYESIKVFYNNIKIQVDGKEIETVNKPFIYNDRVYIPIRDVAEGMGCNVEWDNKTKTVITSKYIDIPECDYLNGEIFVYGIITDIDYDNKKIEVEQHFDDNSIEITPLLELSNDITIVLQRNDKKMNLEFSDLRFGEDVGLILNKFGKIRGIIVS